MDIKFVGIRKKCHYSITKIINKNVFDRKHQKTFKMRNVKCHNGNRRCMIDSWNDQMRETRFYYQPSRDKKR